CFDGARRRCTQRLVLSRVRRFASAVAPRDGAGVGDKAWSTRRRGLLCHLGLLAVPAVRHRRVAQHAQPTTVAILATPLHANFSCVLGSRSRRTRFSSAFLRFTVSQTL